MSQGLAIDNHRQCLGREERGKGGGGGGYMREKKWSEKMKGGCVCEDTERVHV